MSWLMTVLLGNIKQFYFVYFQLQHIDLVMKSYGSQVMQSVKPLIDRDNATNEVREQVSLSYSP